MVTDKSAIVATLFFKEPISSIGGSLVVGREGTTGEPGVVQLHEGRTLRVGRAKSNDLMVENRNVSRFHAVFSASASGVVLSDLSSLNGTSVNGARISTPVDLSSGDVVSIGDSEITVKLMLGEGDTGESTHGRTQTAQLTAVMVSVLVVDVCGYTKLSEALPPKDVAEMMHRWFQNIADIVHRYGGEVDKYIGDCVMALWRGSGSRAKEQATQSVRAALEMLRDTRAMSASGDWQHDQLFPWRCRVAINTGEALSGTVGGAGKRDFTVLGDTVNVAFRLEDMAGSLGTELLISAKTAGMLGSEFPLKSLGTVQVAGRSGEIEVYSLHREA